VHLDAASWRRP